MFEEMCFLPNAPPLENYLFEKTSPSIPFILKHAESKKLSINPKPDLESNSNWGNDIIVGLCRIFDTGLYRYFKYIPFSWVKEWYEKTGNVILDPIFLSKIRKEEQDLLFELWKDNRVYQSQNFKI